MVAVVALIKEGNKNGGKMRRFIGRCDILCNVQSRSVTLSFRKKFRQGL